MCIMDKVVVRLDGKWHHRFHPTLWEQVSFTTWSGLSVSLYSHPRRDLVQLSHESVTMTTEGEKRSFLILIFREWLISLKEAELMSEVEPGLNLSGLMVQVLYVFILDSGGSGGLETFRKTKFSLNENFFFNVGSSQLAADHFFSWMWNQWFCSYKLSDETSRCC